MSIARGLFCCLPNPHVTDIESGHSYKSMCLTFRPYRDGMADYEISAEIEATLLPKFSHRAAEWYQLDQVRPSYAKYARWIVELDGQTIGHCAYEQNPGHYHPHKFKLRGSLLPAYQGRGFGKQILTHLETALTEYDPISLQTGCTEQHPRSIRFLTERNFVEVHRAWQSVLDPSTVNLANWQTHFTRIAEQGIVIKTMDEVEALSPNAMREIYDLTNELDEDIPNIDPPTKIPYDHWLEQINNAPNLDRKAHFFAMDGDALVGYSGLWKNANSMEYRIGLTGVRRAYRKCGIATALKLETIRFAQRVDATRIRTWNASNNHGILIINEQLGFERLPAWIDFVKTIRNEAKNETA